MAGDASVKTTDARSPGALPYLPVFFDLRGHECVLIGGGEAALAKCLLLLRAGARVRVVARELIPSLKTLLEQAQLSSATQTLDEQVFASAALAVIACQDSQLRDQAVALAKQAKVPVNVVDHPSLCDFIMPAIVDRAPVVVAVSSAGRAPVLARMVRARIETVLPVRLGALADLVDRYRAKIKDLMRPNARRRFWEQVLEGPCAELVFRGHDDEAARLIEAQLADFDATQARSGEVFLLGFPADRDPERMTLRALRLLQSADEVMHPPHLPVAMLDLARRDAARCIVPDGQCAFDEVLARARTGARIAWLLASDVALDELADRLSHQGISCLYVAHSDS